ncbi:kinase [Hirsutella rhossiliensis]|uniref:non-specific serine/threonine protein kinase n=1 Tax=Hirsutella rhossiliensis TaxID=111463 RepID=A0A9P8SKY6_9HYPO|nr:kinase [Hirsutella rhossiliensis]KAH0965270.1 kinase [Hirsutella rhossiliensis]
MAENFAAAAVPMAWLVDIIPALRYLPRGFPGTAFKETVKQWSKVSQDVADVPYHFVQQQMEKGSHRPSFVSRMLEQNGDSSSHDEDSIKWTAATQYGAGADTTVASLSGFIVAMVMFPEVQRKAQEEIDRVIGTDRLPQLQDRDNLPYIESMVKEVHRWSTVVPMGLAHMANEDIPYNGHLIPKDPDSFCPDRYLEPRNEPDPRATTFGFGRRVCAGQMLAESTLFITVVQMLAAFSIRKAVDRRGREVEVKLEPTAGVVSHPVAVPYTSAGTFGLHSRDMARRAPGAWKTPPTPDHNQDETSFPGLKPARPDATSKIEYDELQRNEVLALEAIYGDDFVKHVGTPGAWKKAEPSFDIHVRASADSDFAVTVGFVMTATYPKTPPLLNVKGLDNLREATQFKVHKFIETQPKIFAKDEQEMIDKIIEGIRDILEDAAQATATGKQLPSLEEERERHEASLAKLAQEQRDKDERKKLEETKEKERVMSEMLQQQLDRQRQKAKESKLSRRPNGFFPGQSTDSGPDVDQIDFDQFCDTTDKAGNVITFRSVAGKCDPRQGQVSVVYTVRPVIVQGLSNHMVALKEAVLRSSEKDAKEVKEQLQSLESLLQDLKTVKRVLHRQIVEIMDFKVESGLPDDPTALNAWTVRILTPVADKGSLEELLELAGNIEIDKVRSWTRDLLDALNFLHNKNIAHQDIHPGNVLLFREITGEIVPKLSDAWYQREIHNASTQKQSPSRLGSAKSAYWLPPEVAGASKPQYTHKTDIWDFGVVFVQMIFGLNVLQKYSSPRNLMEAITLSQPLQELVSRFFKDDKQKRPRAFELGSSEFLATDAPVFFDGASPTLSTLPLMSSQQTVPARLRRESMNRSAVVSRYTEDFVEEGRLGKGGFGEVVKARKKLDGQVYAIKKVTQRPQASLTEVLKEVRLLSQLIHPAIVRYYNTWVEEVPDLTDTEGDTSTDGFTNETTGTGSAGVDMQFATSTGGLDFMSSNVPVEFGYDDESDEGEDEDDSEDDEESSIVEDDVGLRPTSLERARRASTLRRSRLQRPYRTILYISMEYCEKRTLRDLISRHLCKNAAEIWRLFRQILEGLAHIHGLSIVHRDLKPENIFISSGVDGVDNVKIGDFGLATSDDMTRSIGTAYYSAPEVRSTADGMYSTKVDMYSLGIIFFEMCYEPMLGMQKADVIGQLRRPSPLLPADFKPAEKTQTEIVLALIQHNPRDRPSSADLLESGKLPVQMEGETIRRILSGLSDPSSPYYLKMLSTLFARPIAATKDYAWDMIAGTPSPAELLSQGAAKSALTSIFRRHGALEARRSSIYPRSPYYGDNVVQVLDPNGTVLQLPYDLTLGHARMVAKHPPGIQRTFTFGTIFRDRKDTGQPQMFGEVDFDIVTCDTLDLALKEAEVLKVLDEIIFAFPSLSSGQMCFHVGHSDLLQLIFEHCRIEPACRRAAADVLSKLNIHNHTWHKIRLELRSPAVGLSATSVDELQRFDFRDTPNKAFSKLKMLFEGGDIYQRASSILAHLKEVAEYTKRFGVSTKVYVNPLNSLKESFYVGGILFSCLYDKRVKDVFAAGGRLAWERLARIHKQGGKAFLKKPDDEMDMSFSGKRCDTLVASFDAAVLRSTGIEILHKLWAHDISAELAKDARSPEDLLVKHRDDNYSWIIIIKQDSMLKIKTMGRNDVADVDIHMTKLVSWMRVQDVKVLIAQTRSKKFNRRTVVEQAQASAASLVRSFLDGPILAVETTDQVMDLIRDTSISDHESWRKVEHAVTTSEKKYVRELHDQLDTWRQAYDTKDGSRHSFIYNFRTGNCLYYDLGD